MTSNNPSLPTAPPTSSLPLSFKGKFTSGLVTLPRQFPLLSEIATKVPNGPPPFTFNVTVAFFCLSIVPIIEDAVNKRPNAAVATGLVL